jgi:hypothetical protein
LEDGRTGKEERDEEGEGMWIGCKRQEIIKLDKKRKPL